MKKKIRLLHGNLKIENFEKMDFGGVSHVIIEKKSDFVDYIKKSTCNYKVFHNI